MYYFGDALAEIKTIKGTIGGHLDMTTLPTFAKIEKTVILKPEVKSEPEMSIKIDNKIITRPAIKASPAITETVKERDLGAMVSMLTVAVQQLTSRLEKLEGI